MTTAEIILAGGFGTRIKHLLGELPKPMAPVAGRPFVEWVVRYLARQGVTRAALSTGHLAETIERHFQSAPVAGMKTSCVRETTPLGTGGGVVNAYLSGAHFPALETSCFVAAMITGMLVGRQAASRLPGAQIQKGFAVLLLAVGGFMFWKAFQ